MRCTVSTTSAVRISLDKRPPKSGSSHGSTFHTMKMSSASLTVDACRHGCCTRLGIAERAIRQVGHPGAYKPEGEERGHAIHTSARAERLGSTLGGYDRRLGHIFSYFRAAQGLRQLAELDVPPRPTAMAVGAGRSPPGTNCLYTEQAF